MTNKINKLRPRFQAVRVEADIFFEDFRQILSKECGENISVARLESWEYGYRFPPFAIVKFYMKYFGVSYSYLAGLTRVNGKIDTLDVNFRFPKDMSYAQIKRATGISHTGLLGFIKEDGKPICSFNQLDTFANAFDCSIDYFLGFTTYKSWDEYALVHRDFKGMSKDRIIFFSPKDVETKDSYTMLIGSGRYAILSEDKKSFVFSNNKTIPVTDDMFLELYSARLVKDLYNKG